MRFTGDAKPTRAAIYRIPHVFVNQVRQEVKHMEELGILNVSKSAWSSSLVGPKERW